MTDSDKIQKIVEFMGGWPEHVIPKPFAGCARPDCDIRIRRDEQCYGFNPLTRIEDAMIVVDRLRQLGIFLNLQVHSDMVCAWFNRSNPCLEGFNPARAITEAAWQSLERLAK